jgi:hypothetical protein
MANSRQWYSQTDVVVDATAPANNGDGTRQMLWFIKALAMGQLSSGAGVVGAEGQPPSASNWTCEGSSDGSASAGMDGVDRWTSTYTSNKINFVSQIFAGDRSWIVLKSPAAFGTAVWLTLEYSSNSGTMNTCTASLAYAAPTGGSLTAAPTQNAALSTTGPVGTMAVQVASKPTGYRCHGSKDASGNFWAFSSINSGGIMNTVVGVQTLTNLRVASDPYPAALIWDCPASATIPPAKEGGGGSTFYRAGTGWLGALYCIAYNGAASGRGSIIAPDVAAVASGSYLATMAAAFAQDGNWDSFPCTLFQGGVAPLGIKGDLPDCRLVSTALAQNSRNPPTGTIEKINVGSTLFPMTLVPTL